MTTKYDVKEEIRELKKNQDRIFWSLWIWCFFLSIIAITAFGFSAELRHSTKVPDKIIQDYHSSGELFCEHYNGIFKGNFITVGGICVFFNNDLRMSCNLQEEWINKSEYWSFNGPCLAIKSGYEIKWFNLNNTSCLGDYPIENNCNNVTLTKKEACEISWEYIKKLYNFEFFYEEFIKQCMKDDFYETLQKGDNLPTKEVCE